MLKTKSFNKRKYHLQSTKKVKLKNKLSTNTTHYQQFQRNSEDRTFTKLLAFNLIVTYKIIVILVKNSRFFLFIKTEFRQKPHFLTSQWNYACKASI